MHGARGPIRCLCNRVVHMVEGSMSANKSSYATAFFITLGPLDSDNYTHSKSPKHPPNLSHMGKINSNYSHDLFDEQNITGDATGS